MTGSIVEYKKQQLKTMYDASVKKMTELDDGSKLYWREHGIAIGVGMAYQAMFGESIPLFESPRLSVVQNNDEIFV